MTTSQGADHPSVAGFLLVLTCSIIFQCQEKPTDEPPAVRLAHAAVVVQVLLQVGEHSLDLVVGVGHTLTAFLLAGEQVGQVEVDAVHGCSQSLVRIVGFPIALADGAAVQGLAVVFLPFGIFLQEVVLCHSDKPFHEVLEASGCFQMRVLGEIPFHDAEHVVLAHLDLVRGKGVEQAPHTVNDDSLDDITETHDGSHGIFVIGDGLVLDEGDVERAAALVLQRQKDTPVVTPIGHVQMDEAAPARQVGLLPSDGYVPQNTLDC